MERPPYVLDPGDPRAPSQDVLWVVQVERLARLGVPEYFIYEPVRRRISAY